MRIMEPARPGPLRWVRHRFPDGSTPLVLQQAFETKWAEYEGARLIGGGFDIEWRDVPILEAPYAPCADGNVPVKGPT